MSSLIRHLVNVKEHPDFPGYFINEEGAIFSLRVLAAGKTVDGYNRVTLRKDNKDCQKLAHRLVAETYIPNPENKEQINHIDGNKNNNSVTNLEWVTQAEHNHITHSKTYLVQNVKTKEVIEVFNLSKWCKEMNLHSSGLHHTLSGKHKQHKGWKLLHAT